MTNPSPAVAAREATLCVVNLRKTFLSGSETIHILRGADLCAGRGATIAIQGHSGSGKSTLLNIMGALDRPDSGTVSVAGVEVTAMSERDLAAYRQRRIGFVFQFHYLLRDFTALENVMLPAYMAGLPRRLAIARARALLDDFALSARAGHFPSQLSGGERQRVAVARALVNDPDIIFADEPTGNLDPASSALVAELLFRGAESRGKTLIVVTHAESVASRAGERYILHDGVLSRTPAAGSSAS